MEKILTISIAAYNVEKFINNTLDSLLVKNIDDLEILVEDDGGKDNTANIVKEYENKYPGIVKLVHKENGGYGSTVNKSIELAQGKYFKLLDGDDWVDSNNFENFLELLRNNDVDAIYSPRQTCREQGGSKIADYFDENIEGVYDLEEIIANAKDRLLMHTIAFRTEILRECKLQLFEHCLYTDTQYAVYPIIHCKKILVTHKPVYMYRVGRAEQSVSIPSYRKHYEEQVKVTKALVEFYNSVEKSLQPHIKKYVFDYAKKQVSDTIARFYLLLDANKENLKKR